MASVCVIFFRRFHFFFFEVYSLLYFGGIFNKTIILLALVGYNMIIANSYPPRACGIILKCESIFTFRLLELILKIWFYTTC